MKNLIITSIVALGVAAPAFAQTQLERSVGAEAGQYTLSELVQLKAASDSDGNEKTVHFGDSNTAYSGSDVHNAKAAAIFKSLAAEEAGI